MSDLIPPSRLRKGRGAVTNPACRYDSLTVHSVDDDPDNTPLPRLETEAIADSSRSILNRYDLEEMPFGLTLNPYRGCEHGCIYCYARPSHAYLGYSPGLDFETKLLYKPNAPDLLKKALSRPQHRCEPVLLGSNTDPYQPIEREFQITRKLLEIFLEFQHPVCVITKSSLVERDIDLLSRLAGHDLVSVAVSLTTLDTELARIMEPRAATPTKRLQTMRMLTDHNIPVTLMAAPIIPGLNDQELEAILTAGREAGASRAGYGIVRLADELGDLFTAWLQTHVPDRAERILSLVRQCHGGKLTSPGFRQRMRGDGPLAHVIHQRFTHAHKALEFQEGLAALRRDRFRPSAPSQLSLFSIPT